ncbi:heavy metal translocatin [Mytilinidion resinicola]|uniref:Heavy metal translocatin n=1 Tax=Mytilinidion resinicola TaxID=574789 RepID=A0A6A6YBB7_9PEZI|nr:heavy metal translocatin [Mytilinidion resinicola]KAF2806102.1 heavy metal translocatin [Mytilinidion resinicola]
MALPSPTSTQGRASITTTVFISNLHCPSCIVSIQGALSALHPPPEVVSHSIVSHEVILRHSAQVSVDAILDALELAGFEVHSIFQDSEIGIGVESERRSPEWQNSLEQAVNRWRHSRGHAREDDMQKRKRHVEQCALCRIEEGDVGGSVKVRQESGSSAALTEKEEIKREEDVGEVEMKGDGFVFVDDGAGDGLWRATLAISGMTCASCVASISRVVGELGWVRSVDVNLLTASGSVVFEGKHHAAEVVEVVEDAGFEVTLQSLVEVAKAPVKKSATVPGAERWKATYSIEGMTCSSCVGNVTDAVKGYTWIEHVDVNLVSNSATVTFTGKDHLAEIQEAIEDSGYGATLDTILPIDQQQEVAQERSMAIRIEGMFCHHCPPRIIAALNEIYGDKIECEKPPLNEKTGLLRIKYLPSPPDFTIRHIVDSISAIDAIFKPSIYHPPTLEERAHDMHARERRRILFRLVLSFTIAIPTFILGIVYMSLVPASNRQRRYLMEPMWAGNIPRIQWALFFLSTPVYLFAADTFHVRALKELRAMWRPGSRTPFFQRFYRFGSMNMLMSLGTTIAYFASIVELIRAGLKKSTGSLSDSYFDSVVFLTMFLLIGRFLEAYSKAKTGDAVTSLGKLRPDEAILVGVSGTGDRKISVDLLEIGDVVRVPHGTSPPFDGLIAAGSAKFDESSLTGEARLVNKEPGDTVFSGTINKGGAITVQINTVSGTSMLDQIINVVREGQARRAPVERVADVITSHFVPFVVLVAIVTWVIWLSLGLTGTIPDDWRDKDSGGWELWSLRFAIAVFVVACPCGIGLAAPTALFVGGGLAAKHGILVKGGGEAFQEASSLDCIVFDKTGTLTQGGDPEVTDYEIIDGQGEGVALGMATKLEESSTHPIAKSLVAFCASKVNSESTLISIDEIPGKGLKGVFKPTSETTTAPITALIGNETFMVDHGVVIPASTSTTLNKWKSEGKSVALFAISSTTSSADFILSATFAISDPLRPEAASTISSLHASGIDVWMLSGDNETTARAVGASVGIPSDHVIAGVLPSQKAEKIKYLQRTLPSPRKFGSRGKARATVAMVGDGINDAPALATADVSIAIGSGSDVAVSSASFVLITSDLRSITTLIRLSKKVFRRVKFNFGWALVYNLIAMPVAAGALFAVRTGGGGHVRLDPVWASLAMAMSSLLDARSTSFSVSNFTYRTLSTVSVFLFPNILQILTNTIITVSPNPSQTLPNTRFPALPTTALTSPQAPLPPFPASNQ